MYPNARPPPYELPGTGHELPQFTSQRLQTDIADTYVEPTTAAAGRLATHDRKLDFTQRIERKLAEYNASQNVLKRWLFEIGSWLVSAICMGSIIGIYIWLRDKPMSQVGQLLTYANILGKVASAALIVPTSEALGQLKWNWFHKSKAMWDFEIFDKASRGPTGAIMLLFRTKGRSLAALGALLIVLLLAIDTFFQQVVVYTDRWTLQSIAGTLPRVLQYRPALTPPWQLGYEMAVIDRDLGNIGRDFFWRNGTQPVPFGNGTRPEIPLSCPTSNCTWPPYETLGICSGCTDVTKILNSTFACLNTTIYWSAAWIGPLKKVPYPNGTVCGHFINATSTAPTLLSGYVLPEHGDRMAGEALLVSAIPLTDFDTKMPLYGNGSIAYKHVGFPILDALVSSARNGTQSVYRDEPPIVHECMVTWCVKTIRSSYEWGVYREETLSTFIEPAKESDVWPWAAWEVEIGLYMSYNQSIALQPPKPRTYVSQETVINDVYKIDNTSHTNVMNFWDDVFPSWFTVANNISEPWLRHSNYPNGPITRRPNYIPWLHPNNITHHMERMAEAMTNAVRSSTTKEMLEGHAYITEAYISIKWEWLSFPLLLLVLTLAFLVSTIKKTAGDGATGVWKTSAMPTLIYGLPKETQGQFASAATWSSGNGAQKKTRIKLLPNLGWRVSGQSHLSRSPRLPSGERVPRGWI
ncbi:hypothetical protein FB567DRAFT_487165 [Paraphoma chrysanthemicola]|uniref:DUF3176 domain containing protein n=1 Tax=Paraphoma chrysanthemicola TaxID=798071 RepID=A0A8K0RED4_9PLEO|nr:hypothetical protein FB567DRAFT_487165 [Paraphoma chrysanthemicola]